MLTICIFMLLLWQSNGKREMAEKALVLVHCIILALAPDTPFGKCCVCNQSARDIHTNASRCTAHTPGKAKLNAMF